VLRSRLRPRSVHTNVEAAALVEPSESWPLVSPGHGNTRCFDEARERADGNVDTAADHDVFELTRLDEMANLALREADSGGELLRGFEAVSRLAFPAGGELHSFSARPLGLELVGKVLVPLGFRYRDGERNQIETAPYCLVHRTQAGLVRLYCEKHRNPHLPPFIIHKPHDMKSWYATPESSKQGCYVFYSKDGEVLYVGKASLSASMGSRLAAHDRRIPRSQWRERAAFVQFVSVTEPFEAPSLEEFLIERLRPTGNVRGPKPQNIG
jgi:hypothetical protein